MRMGDCQGLGGCSMTHRPVTQLTVPDALAASAHGLDEAQWRRLTDTERQELRWNTPPAQNGIWR